MNHKSLELLEKYVGKNYVTLASQNQISHENEIRILLEKVYNQENIKLLFNKKV